MPGKFKTNCYLLKKQPYSETSILMQVFSDTQGMISVLAKGMRKGKEHNDYLLNVLNEYEFVLSASSPSGIHNLAEMALLEEYPTDLALDTWFAAQAGAEILTKLMLPDEEIPLFYRALKQYLDYLKTVAVNPLAIFWRYLLYLDKLLGVPVNLLSCSSCHQVMGKPAGYSADTGQLLCGKCTTTLHGAFILEPEASNVIALLPIIGNYLNDLFITPETARQINRFLLHYLTSQFHKNINLNSLQFFEAK
jgi:DNA repair protein RecO